MRGWQVSRKRVARLMRALGIEGLLRRRKVRTTVKNGADRPPPDLVDRDFSATVPDRLRVADITHIATLTGPSDLAVVLDAFSRRVVGWALAAHLRTELVLIALDMALERRRPLEVIHHSDRGASTPRSGSTTAVGTRECGLRWESVGDCHDNAMAESFFATLECELPDRTRIPNGVAAEREVFALIEGWCNTRRRHSAFGYLSPVAFEKRFRDAE